MLGGSDLTGDVLTVTLCKHGVVYDVGCWDERGNWSVLTLPESQVAGHKSDARTMGFKT